MKKSSFFGVSLFLSLHMNLAHAQPSPPQANVLPSIHRVFIFGDSLSDIGNLQAKTLSILPSTKNYFMGRFSDGEIWVDDLAADYGTTVNDHQFINDYAVGGATAFPYANKESVFRLGYRLVGNLGHQLHDFSNTYHQFKSSDLIIVWIGANDLLWAGDMFFCGKLTTACIDAQVQRADQKKIVQWAIMSVKNQVQKMEAVYGAKHILILGLPDFSIIPRYTFDQHPIAPLKGADVQSYNTQLKTFIEENQAAHHDIAYYDVDKMFKELIHSPSLWNQYNFTDVRHSCLYRNSEPTNHDESAMALDRSNPFFTYAMIPVLRESSPNLTEHQNYLLPQFKDKTCGKHFLFWDTLHPTKEGHLFIMQNLLDYILKHFRVSRPHTDESVCYNLQVVNQGWYLLDVSQNNNTCGPKHTYLLKNNEKLISVAYNKPVKFKAELGRSITFSHLPSPINGLGVKIKCTGTTIDHFNCTKEN